MRHRQIVWLESPSLKARPCIILTRDATIPFLSDVLVAPMSTNVLGLDTEVVFDPSDGLPRHCSANLQRVFEVPKSHLREKIGTVDRARWHEVCEAMAVAIGC